MALLIGGLVLFIGAHLLPASPALRADLVARLGMGGYRAAMSLVSLGGFVLIVIGKGAAPFVAVYPPPGWGANAAQLLMLPVFPLLVAAYAPSNLRRYLRHPMLWAVVLWASAHLLANGDLASLLLFGAFGAWALFDMASANRRGASLATQRRPWWNDLLAIAVGLLLYAAVFRLHAALFGVAAGVSASF